MTDKRSQVWKHLLAKVVHDKKLVKCMHCGKEFKDVGSTSSFTYHMAQKHKIKFGLDTTSQRPVSDFFPKTQQSPGHVLASMAAVDRISFKTLAESKEIRKGWEAQGLSMPKSDHGVR